MATKLDPYLHFETECRDAMTHYQAIFGGELEVNTYGEFGMDGDPDQVLNASLSISEGLVLMASDAPPGTSVGPGSVSLTGDDEEQLRGWFDALAEGGEVQMPMEKQMWGDVFGQCADRFGVTWLVNVGPGGS